VVSQQNNPSKFVVLVIVDININYLISQAKGSSSIPNHLIPFPITADFFAYRRDDSLHLLSVSGRDIFKRIGSASTDFQNPRFPIKLIPQILPVNLQPESVMTGP
jgi:hypothetical protein